MIEFHHGLLGRFDYVVMATRGEEVLATEFQISDFDMLFEGSPIVGARGDMFMVDADGHVLTPLRDGTSVPAAAINIEPISDCLRGTTQLTAIDYRGVNTIHGLHSTTAFFGGACVDAHLAHDEAVAPAETLRAALIARGEIFAIAGIVVSLFAAHRIAAPVRRLVQSARALEGGAFDTKIRDEGPSELQALSWRLSRMAHAIADLVARERVARRAAEMANRAKDDFLATLSHELRTPLTAILGWARLLRQGHLEGESIQRAAAAIERGAQAQARLVEDLLDISRIVAGKLELTRTEVSLLEPTAAAIEAIRPDAEGKGVSVRLEASESLPPVLGDSHRLQQVVSNLLTNAVKFTPKGGHVFVSLRPVGNRVELSVRDTGSGIPPEFLPHVFERFRQADGVPRGSRPGLGIGLAIARHLVELQDGEISVASEGANRGSTFTISLPAAYVAATANIAQSAARSTVDIRPQLLRLRDVSVLLIDDDEDTLGAVRATLEHVGARVETAVSAAEARTALAVSRPSVIVSDIVMPNEDGYAFMRSIREANATVPAIALTAASRRGIADEARAAGFQILMQKPVSPDKLVDAVASLARPGLPQP